MMSLLSHLPGETPIEDTSCHKIKDIRQRRELSGHEAENIRKAATKYLVGKVSKRKAPFDYSWSLKLHREMFADVRTWAGRLRTGDLNLGVPYRRIETSLYDLFGSIPYWSNEPWITQAAMLHHKAVWIHPFPNGNGRWSRMLANIWLHRNGQQYTNWPEQTVGEKSVSGTNTWLPCEQPTMVRMML